MTALLVVIIVAILALLGLASAVRIVTQYEQGVLSASEASWDHSPPGLRLIIPVADVLHRVSLRMYGSGDPHEKSSYTYRVSSQNRNRCAGNSIVQIPVENWVSSIFLELLAQPEFARRHAGMVARALDDGEQRAGKQLEQLRQLQDELAEAATGATGLAQAVGSKGAEIAEVRAALAESRVAPESLETFIGHDPRQIWDTATQGQRAAWLAAVCSRIEILPALSGNCAEKGGFGSRGLDPRRVRIHTHHDPANPIVVSADYQRPAPDMGGPVECPDCHKELENWARLAAHRRWSHGVVSKEKAARGETATEHRCYEKGCSEVFYVEMVLRDHLWNEHGITQGSTPAPSATGPLRCRHSWAGTWPLTATRRTPATSAARS
ncbi:MAG: Regulator of protease HflC, stomatin/prohibitin superfamily [Blastococcus sp.]|nr:Regulator of protease HflC, stomatin/prohibitin superfamily [Blastococcus sp.]